MKYNWINLITVVLDCYAGFCLTEMGLVLESKAVPRLTVVWQPVLRLFLISLFKIQFKQLHLNLSNSCKAWEGKK